MARFLICLIGTGLSLTLTTCTPLMVPMDQTQQASPSPKTAVAPSGDLEFAAIQPPHERRAGVDVYSIRSLRDAINAHTELHAALVGEGAGLSLMDERLADVPVILLSYPPAESEWRTFTQYLLAGGFFITAASQSRAIDEGLKAQGLQEFYTADLPEKHPVFNALYDLQKAPATGTPNQVPTLTGCFVQGRLAGVFAEGPLWSISRTPQNAAGLPPRIKLIINLMAYALQEEGSLTWKRQHPEGTSPADPASIKK